MQRAPEASSKCHRKALILMRAWLPAPAPALGMGETGKFGFGGNKEKPQTWAPLAVALKPAATATGKENIVIIIKKKKNQVQLHS